MPPGGRDLYTHFVEEYDSSKFSNVHFELFSRKINQWDEDDFQEFHRLGGHVDKCTRVAGNVASWTTEIIVKKYKMLHFQKLIQDLLIYRELAVHSIQ